MMYSICLKGFPGANQALENLQRTTELTRHIRVTSTHPDSPEIAFVIEHIRVQSPRVILFGGWSPVYESLIQGWRDLQLCFAVYWTSSGGQTDISQEVSKLAALLESKMISTLCFSSRAMARAFRHVGVRALYLPLTMVEPHEPVQIGPTDPLLISLFSPPAEYRRKNILNALLALAQVRGAFSLALNGLSQDAAYAVILQKLGFAFQEWGWLPREIYEERLWRLGFGLQLSFAETFNYIAAEQLLRGIPVLTSPMTPVMDLLDETTRAQLVIPRADDADAIRERIQALLDAPTLRRELGARARVSLLAANAENIHIARQVLMELLAET